MAASSRFINALCLTTLAALACDAPAPAGGLTTGFVPAPSGVRLAYQVRGNGPDTVVVLHGGPGLHANTVRGIADALGDGRTIILYDQRGLGRSDPVADSGQLTAANDVTDLEAVRTYFHLDRLNIVAHHWGAIVAALYAKRYPDHIGRLVLVSPSFLDANGLFHAATLPNDERETAAYIAAVSSGQDTTSSLRFCQRFWGFAFTPVEVTAPWLVARLRSDMCDATPLALTRGARVGRVVASSMHGLNLRDTLTAIRAPVLVVVGGGDSAVASSARQWVALLPQAQLRVLDQPALFPWLEDRRRFADAAARFLSSR